MSHSDHQPSDDRTRHELTAWLASTAPLWQPRPFIQLPPPWEAELPEVARQLRALSLDQAEHLHEHPDQLVRQVPSLSPIAARCAQLSQWPSLPRLQVKLPPHPLRIPGRKWNQVTSFLEAAFGQRGASGRWLDWCAGKGHLGRTLARATGAQLVCVDAQAALCDEGAALTRAEGSDARFVTLDVLGEPARVDELLSKVDGVVALHSCGQLHMSLMRRAARAGCPTLVIAPCCYQRIEHDYYQPMSAWGVQSDLVLHRHFLRLVSLAEVVAGAGERRRRQQAQTYRLAFDLLQRQVTGQDEYRSVRRVPPDWFALPFDRFARQVAEREEIDLPAGLGAGRFLADGSRRLQEATALSLLRSLFRRTLESWLVWDRICFLQERGYRVVTGTFCERRVTPRNLMIVANRGVNA